jgi:hypothetical protein
VQHDPTGPRHRMPHIYCHYLVLIRVRVRHVGVILPNKDAIMNICSGIL